MLGTQASMPGVVLKCCLISVSMKYVFWYWREYPDFKPETCLDLANTQIINDLKKYEIPYAVYQYIKHRDKEFLKFCKSLHNEKVVYFVPEECRLFLSGYLDQVYKILQKNNLKLEIWLGNFEETQGVKTVGIDLPNDRISVINWNTFLMYESFYYFAKDHLKVSSADVNIDRPFVCLNNRVTYYRCKLVESLSRNDLLSKGYVSWIKSLDDGIYDDIFESFDNMPRLLDRNEENQSLKTHQLIYEEKYFKGFVNIISEGEVMLKDISEKTFYAILHKKPFLILGSSKIHKTLKALGFELYDNLFDYSFDDEECIDKRIEGIIQNIKSIENKDYNVLYKILSKKLEKNFNRYIEILKKEDNNMKLFLKHLNNTKENSNEHDILLDYYRLIQTFKSTHFDPSNP